MCVNEATISLLKELCLIWMVRSINKYFALSGAKKLLLCSRRLAISSYPSNYDDRQTNRPETRRCRLDRTESGDLIPKFLFLS